MADTTEHVALDDAKLNDRQALASALIEIAIRDDEDDESLGYREGDTVGRYTLVKVLGRGGFGVVWEARQTEPIIRDVALKIILPGMDSKAVIGRFRTERQALARMSHPNIAMVLDADTTEDSLPYFVMELVRGEPITTYAKTWQLGVRERIAIFIDVCGAVQHAHQRAILHRDLKPSNLLVARVNDQPMPKVIDFGIAKALTEDAGDMPSIVFTMHGQMIGTPQYMAPEHAMLGSDQVDVRADVYSLGAVLYELLTGRPQIETDETRPTSAKEIFQRVCQEDPIKPSTRIQQIKRSHPTPEVHSLQVDRELDWIVLKALEKSPDDRYASVDALAADLQRYLKDEPLSVGPPTALYRLRKLVQKNRAAFFLSAVIVVSLIAVTGISYAAYTRESRARIVADDMRRQAQQSQQQAVAENRKATQLVEFLSDLLDHAGENVDRGKNPEALRIAIDQSTREIDKFKDQPELQATLCDSLAKVFEAMGDSGHAVPLRERQWQIYRARLGPQHYDTLEIELSLAAAQSGGDAAKALVMSEDICRTLEAQGKMTSPLWFEARKRVAADMAALGRGPEAMVIARDLMGRRNGRGEPATERVSFLKSLGELQRKLGDLDGAEQTYVAGLDQLPDDPRSTSNMHQRAALLRNLSRVDADRGHFDIAIGHLVEAVDLDKEARGARNPGIINMLIELSRHYGKTQRADDAVGLTIEALSIAREVGDIPQQIHGTRACAEVLEEGARDERALVFRRDCEKLTRDYASDRADWMEDLRTLTRLLTRLQKHEEAEQRAKALWTAMQAYPQAVSTNDDFSRNFYQTLIDTCEAWQAANGSHAHDADITLWRSRLKEMQELP